MSSSKGMTVVQLRAELGKRGAATSGLKSDLAERLDALNSGAVSPQPTAARGGASTAKKSQRPEPDARESFKKRARRGQLFPEPKDKDDAASGAASAGAAVSSAGAAYVPEALHALVGYARRGQGSLEPGEAELFAFVEAECRLPADLEQNHKYGPLSGSTFEGRAIGAFAHGLLGDASLSPTAKASRRAVRKSVLEGDFVAAAAAAAAAVL